MSKPKLDQVIIDDLKSQMEEYSAMVISFEDKGIENLGIEETEDYGFFLGKVSQINDMLGKYSD
jgi:hypothetical protein